MTKHSQSTSTLLITAVIIFAGCVGVFVYALHYLFGESREVSTLAQEVHLADNRSEYLASIKDVVRDTRAEQQQLAALYLKEDDVVAFIEEVEALIRTREVTFDLQSVDIRSIESTEEYSWLELSLEIEGAWADVFALVSQIERLPFVLVLDSLRIETPEEAESLETWSAELRVRVALSNEVSEEAPQE